jgi:hypothetical protein
MSSTHMHDSPPGTGQPPVCHFRIRFLGPVLGLAFLASTVTALLIFLDGRNRPINTVGLLIARLVPVPLAALMVGLFVWLCPIRVTPRGIKYPAWPLVVREVPWGEMHTVRYVNLLGFRFLAVYREGAAVGLWLPLFLKSPDLFCEVVCACLGNDHPLSASLMRNCACKAIPEGREKVTGTP